MTLRRAVVALLVSFAGAAGAVVCPPPALAPSPDQAAQGARDATDNGLLWKATKGGRTAYLYGTIHVAKLAWIFPGPKTLAALRASDVVALELNLVDPAVIERLRQAIAARPGAPALAPELQARLTAQMAAACIAPDTLAPLRPEMQAVTIQVMQGRGLGLYPDYGIDEAMALFAVNLRKPVRALETPEMQAALLVSDDPRETAETVEGVMDELEGGKSPQMLERLAGDWQRGDLADLDAYASWCECLDTPQQRADFHKLVGERNPLMADKIVQWLAEGRSLFVAVGSLHMVGKDGLPALLKARGFQVERVVFASTPR